MCILTNQSFVTFSAQKVFSTGKIKAVEHIALSESRKENLSLGRVMYVTRLKKKNLMQRKELRDIAFC